MNKAVSHTQSRSLVIPDVDTDSLSLVQVMDKLRVDDESFVPGGQGHGGIFGCGNKRQMNKVGGSLCESASRGPVMEVFCNGLCNGVKD